jgi:hypothetical protein
MSTSPGDKYSISVGGSVGGHMVVGNQNTVTGSPSTVARPTEAELAAFQAAVDAVKAQAITAAPPAEAVKAIEQLTEFHAAATAPEPDLSKMQQVRTWFVQHLPTMAGAVTGLLVHPVVGALVKSAGDAVTAEFQHRFGSASESKE